MSLPLLAATARLALLQTFGRESEGFAQAHGRVNLIGEHTDYNDGFVLPCAIDRGCVVAWAPRDDAQVRVVAGDAAGQTDRFGLDADIEAHDGRTLDATALAQAAQRAENEFVGCRCGIMDQLVSARGVAAHALLIDCRSLTTQPIALPADTTLLIAHSRVRRGLVDSAYNERRAASEAAARTLGVPALRDTQLPDVMQAALDPTTRRRARHVVTENRRTTEAAAALARSDLRAMGALMAESHASMRDDFEITVPAIDHLAALMHAAIGGEGGPALRACAPPAARPRYRGSGGRRC